MTFRFARRRMAALVLLGSLCSVARAVGETPVDFDIDAQPLETAVKALASQAGLRVFWPEGLSDGHRQVARLHERLTAKAALDRLLAGTAIRYTLVSPDVIAFQPAEPETTPFNLPVSSAVSHEAVETQTAGIPDVLIRGSRSLNVDIQRTPDDARPVQVIDRSRIARSSARTLPDLLRLEVTALDPPFNAGGPNVLAGQADQLNLRGLGSAQTLILINGRRVAGRSLGADAQQPDLSTIALEAIERVEVLPATASARYGGGPAGGAINIVLNQHAPGTRVSVRAGQLTHSTADLRQLWAEHVLVFDDDRGRLAISGTWSRQAPVELRDWDFLTRGRQMRAQNDPQFVRASPVPPVGRRTNVTTTDGSPLLPGGYAPNLCIPPGYQKSQGLAPLAAVQGQYCLDLADSAQANGGAHATVRPGVEVRSATATGRWDFTSVFSADFDAAYGKTIRSATASGADYALLPGTRLPKEAATNPFGKDVYVTAPFSSGDALMQSEDRTQRALAGLGARLPRDWAARVEFAWSSSVFSLSRPVLQGNGDPIAAGLDVLVDPIREADAGLHASTLFTTPVRSTTKSTLLSIAGSPLTLPGGDATLSLSAERRREWLARGSALETLIESSGGTPQVRGVIPEQREVTDVVYAELQLPLISRRSDESAHPLLETQLAFHADRVRIDAAADDDPAAPAGTHSSSRFGARSWMAALAFRPADFFLLRASCGTGFVAPPMSELTPSVTRRINFPLFIDPVLGEPVSSFDVIAGGNPHLHAERSRSCSGGVVLEIGGDRALRFSADYTSTWKDDVVFVPAALLFSDPRAFVAQFPDLIVRAPSDGGSAGSITLIDGSARNLSHQEIRALDLSLDSLFRTDGLGTFGFSLRGSILPVFASQLSSLAPLVNDAGIGPLAPPLWKLNANLTYERGPWTLGWSTRYVSRYRVSRDSALIQGQGSSHVPGQAYHDLFSRYTLQMRGHGPAFHVQLGVRNVFRRMPPNDVASSDYASRQGVAEIPSYELSVGADWY